MTPEQQTVVDQLEAEIGRPLTTSEQDKAEAFMKTWRLAAARQTYGDTTQGVIADVLDRATYGALSPGRTFDAIVPSTYEVAVAVGGFPTPEEVIFGVNGQPIRPDTPALYLERLKAENFYDFASDTPNIDQATQQPTFVDGEVDPRLQELLNSEDPADVALAQIIIEDRQQSALDDLPNYLGGIPQGTLLPQNFAEVEQNFKVDAGKYQHTKAMLKKEMIEAGPAQPSYSVTSSSRFPTEAEFGGSAPVSNAADRVSIGKAQSSMGSAPIYGEGDYAPTMGSPTYLPGDQYSNFATKDPGYINGVQQGLVAAGLLDEDDFIDGVWTRDAAKAMENAMIEANFTGGAETWVDIVKGRAESNAAKPQKPSGSRGSSGRRANPLAGRTLVLPAYEKPDTDILNTEVRDLMRQRLGRNPTGWELTLLADKLGEGYRADYDAQVKTAKANFEAGNKAILQSYRTGKPVTVTTQEGERVDPRAYLTERFENRYAPEMELNKDRELSRDNMQNVFSVLTSTSRILGGP